MLLYHNITESESDIWYNKNKCSIMVRRFAFLLTFLLALASTQGALADAPPGFRLIQSAPGVQLFRKDYANGTPDFVQVVRLDAGAEVRLLHAPVKEDRPGVGAYGGDDPRLGYQSIQGFWQALNGETSQAFCVTNGQFFLMRESPTRLPFPLKVDGQIVSDGYAKQEFPEQKLILELWPDRAAIAPLSREALYNSTAPNIVAGLTEDARKSPTKYVGRTFVGVADQDANGAHETVLIFSTRSARQKDAADVLRGFGARQVMMLDGGGSAQLTCDGESLVASERLIPQALGVVAAPEVERGYQIEIVSDTADTPALSVQETPETPVLAEAILASASLPEARLAASSPLVDDLSDLLWIPLMMGPIFLGVFFVVLRIRVR